MRVRKSCVRLDSVITLAPWHVAMGLFLLLGCGGLMLAGCSQDPEAKRVKHFTRGQRYLIPGKPGEAEQEYRAAVRANPTRVEPRLLLIQSLLRRKQWDAGIQVGREALAVNAKSAPVQILPLSLAAGRESEAGTG